MIDYRQFCSDMRDQLDCGSCTAFGTWSAWETILRMNEIDYDGSERDLFLRSGGICSMGNHMEPVLNTAKKWIASEEDCPYVPRDTRCQKPNDWIKRSKSLDSWKEIKNQTQMKELIKTVPMVGVMAVHQSFLHYKGGIYSPLGRQDPIVGYHCIGIVGYDAVNDAWLLRNSWSEDWGMKGYCWIRCGTSEIDDVMYSITLNPNDPPEPNPNPEPEKPWWQRLIEWLIELWERIT